MLDSRRPSASIISPQRYTRSTALNCSPCRSTRLRSSLLNLHDTRLAEILSEHYLVDPMLATPFFVKENGALRRKGLNRPPALLQAMNDELRDTLAEFLKVNRDATAKDQGVGVSGN